MADIRLALQVDSSGAITGVKTFNEEVGKIPAKATGASTALKKMADSFTAGLGIGAGIETFKRAFSSLESITIGAARALGTYSDEIVTLNQRTGLSIASLQAFKYMAATSGTDVGSLSAAVVKMEIALGKGSSAFGKLGLSVSDLKAMKPEDAFAAVAKSVGGIEDPMQRASAAVAIFGKSGAEMLPVFANDMEAAKKQAEEFGLVLSDKAVRGAEALGDAVDTAGMAFQSLLMRLVSVVGESPEVLAFFENMAKFFGDLAPLIEKNKEVLMSFVRDAVDAAVESFGVLADSIMGALNLLQMMRVFGQNMKMSATGMFGADLTGDQAELARLNAQWDKLEQLTVRVGAHVDKFKKNMSDAAKINFGDMGGLGVLARGGMGGAGVLMGGSGAKSGATLPTFDDTKTKKLTVDELKVPNLGGVWADLFHKDFQGKFGTLQGGSKTFDLWGDKSKFLPPEVAGNIHVEGVEAKKKEAQASMTASQALQNLANIASLSGSKLAKGLAGIFGGASGISAGLGSLFGDKKTDFGKGITGILGKAGAWGSIAASALSIGSSLFGMFKKKPKEPPPEPPKQASAEAWRSFVGDQQSKGAAGVLAGVSGIRITSEADMAAQASIASQTFWATFKSQGLIKAADAFKGVRDKMVETFRGFGASQETIDALIGPMSQMVDLAGNESFRGAADGANGYAEALASIVNTQMPMSIDQFRAFEQQAVSGFEQMKQAAVDQGMSMTDAIKTAAQGSGQYLQTIKDAASRYGFDLGGSQALFDAAAGAGVAFGGSSEERLILSIDRLTETLGGAPPKFEAAFAAGGSAAGDRIGAAAQTGQAGTFNAADMGASIVSGLGRAIEQLRGDLRSQPIEISLPDINLDGNALASGLAVVVDRGGGGGQRLQTALEGRAF